jgi:hypothetical protein
MMDRTFDSPRESGRKDAGLMAGDDLHDPLGLDRSSVRAPARTISLRLISLSVLCLAFLAAFAFLRFFGDSSGGEPQAVAAIATEKPDEFGAPAQKAASEPNANKSDAAQGMIEDAAELEQKSGVKVVPRMGAVRLLLRSSKCRKGSAWHWCRRRTSGSSK